MSKIIIYTQAYNAGETLSVAMDSVLNQTYSDFVYIVLDNGSTDNTADIISEYAQRDKRVVARYESINDKYRYTNIALEYAGMYEDGWMAMLDADDEYYPDFLEKMLAFVIEKELDIAMCCTCAFQESGEYLGRIPVISHNIIMDESGLTEHFHLYSKYLFYWGKFFSFSVLRKCLFENVKKVFVGNDAVFTIEAFGYAQRIGILNENLHRYNFSSNSRSTQYNPKRVEGCAVYCSCLLQLFT